MADDITVKVGFDGTQAETGLGKLRKESDDFATQLTKRLTGAFAAMTLFDRGVAFATKTFEKFADVSDKAERAGISAEDFQRIGYAAELSGTSMEAAAKAMREIRNATADAAAGSKKAADALLNLGFTREEIAKGDIKATEVLLRLASAYKAAGSDAAKFGVATSILSTKSASEMVPLLGTNQAELGQAMKRDVASNEVAQQMKAVADQTKMATQALELFTISLISAAARAYASFQIVFNDVGANVRRTLVSANQATDPQSKAKLEKKALEQFDEYAQMFRVANIGRVVNGELMTAKRTEEVLAQRFAEFGFSPKLQKERAQALADQAGGRAAESTVSMAAPTIVASSLAAVGGGGGVYSTDMIDLASRTADAAERTANAVEQMAGITPEESSPVSSQ